MNAIESGVPGRARKGAAALIIAMTAAACSKERPNSAPDGDVRSVIASPVDAAEPFGDLANTAGAHEDPSPMATVKVLEAGKPPRTKLRYGWRTEQAERLVMDLQTSASAAASGGAEQPAIPLPPVHVVVAIDPRDVSAGGDLRYAWRVTSGAVLTDARAPSPVISGMRAEVLAIEHLAGTAVVTARGLAREVNIDPATVIDAGATGQMVEQIRQTLRDVAAPLPEEEVGRGARWQKQSQLDARQTQITQTETFTLGELQADRGTLTDVLAQSAPAQTLHAPGMAPAAQARMESMLASGNASIRFDLSRVVPQTRFDGTTTMVVSGRSTSDSARRLTMVLHVGIVITGSRR